MYLKCRTRRRDGKEHRHWSLMEKHRVAVQVKLLPHEGELYVLVQSQDRIHKERALPRRKLRAAWKRLQELQTQRPGYEALLLKLGAAKAEAGRAWSLVTVPLPAPPSTRKARTRRADFTFTLNREALRAVLRREGRYLLRTNLTETNPAKLWEFYLRLVEVEAAFKNLKGDLALRPIYHQREDRIKAHIFVAFLAYCLHVTLRAVLEKFTRMQLLDVHFPTTDERELIFTRYTQPETDQQLLLGCGTSFFKPT